MRRKGWLVLGALALTLAGWAKEGAYLVYPGDRDIWMGLGVQARRIERGQPWATFWPAYGHFPVVVFSKDLVLERPAIVRIEAEGACRATTLYLTLDRAPDGTITIPAGTNRLSVTVFNSRTPPCLKVSGDEIWSDASWKVSLQDKRTVRAEVLDTPASRFPMRRVPIKPARIIRQGDTLLVDFGRETFGFATLRGIARAGRARLVFAESEAEARDKDGADIWLDLDLPQTDAYPLPDSRGFRWIAVHPLDPGVQVQAISAEEESLGLTCKGAFVCDDLLLNRIYQTCVRTLELTAREFFLDGIKRDRWVWSGDAAQSYLMNYYTFFDGPIVRRTSNLLRGKDPIYTHINTILDYSLFWFTALDDYLLFTGDADYLAQLYPRMQTLMDYCQKQVRPDGFLYDKPGDWVFIDWAPAPMSKNGGAASFVQILFAKALRVMASAARRAGDLPAAERYQNQAEALRKRIREVYWNPKRGGLMHFLKPNGTVSEFNRYANLFALFDGYFTPEEARQVARQVLLNPAVMPIHTPYMRFYELEALCTIGRHREVLRDLRAYWGGMLELGATTFWELYNPNERGNEHLAMYGRPYGRSLCHAWGAGPVYLLGRYFLGVAPTAPGYASYEVRPNLGGLKWMKGKVPTPHGDITVEHTGKTLTVTPAPRGQGTLITPWPHPPKTDGPAPLKGPDGTYRIPLTPGKTLTLR